MKISPFKIDEFIRNIENNQEISAAVIFGPESGLISIRAKEIANKIVSDKSDPFAISDISVQQIEENGNILFDEFFSISMFGPARKLIKISPANNKITKNLIRNKLIDTFYLFQSPKILSKNNEYQSFTSLKILDKNYKKKYKFASKLAKDNIIIYKK